MTEAVWKIHLVPAFKSFAIAQEKDHKVPDNFSPMRYPPWLMEGRDCERYLALPDGKQEKP